MNHDLPDGSPNQAMRWHSTAFCRDGIADGAVGVPDLLIVIDNWTL
jgi:hypothetical protein